MLSLFEAQEQAAQTGEPAAAEMRADAQDAQGDAAGDGAGASAVERRQSKRIASAVNHGSKSSADSSCELWKRLGVVFVSGAADMPEQGCYCGSECAGEGGGCTNQVPLIETDENVEVVETGTICGRCLVAKRDFEPGDILTLFAGVVVSKRTHLESYEIFSNIHKLQQQTEKGQQKFEYTALTGSTGMLDSQAWVIPPEDMPLLKQRIDVWEQQNTHLDNLIKNQRTWQKGLGQFAQHTCCEHHVNAYLFPIYIMREAGEPPRGSKRSRNVEIMHIQALAIRAQKHIKKAEQVLVQYVSQKRDLWFDCRCCKCVGPCRR